MSGNGFESWLAQELGVLNADEEVFKPYILSILEEEEGDEAMAEALDGVVESMMEDAGEAAVKKFRNAILDKWKEHKSGGGGGGAANNDSDACEAKLSALDLGAKLASITESQTAAYNANRASAAANASLPGPDKSVKEAILAQYAGAVEESDDDEDGEEDGGGEDVARNVNAEAVARAEQEKREKSRAAAAAKKDKDKEDREKQKKEAEDRKKKAQDKAAKGERRR